MSKKVQFKIRIDPEVFDQADKLDEIMNKYRRKDSHGNLRVNVTKSMYWEAIMSEHLNSRDVRALISARDIKDITEGVL